MIRKHKAVKDCPLAKGTLLIQVWQKTNRAGASGVRVTYSGPESGGGLTDKDGYYEKTNLIPGSYDFKVEVAGTSFNDYAAAPEAGRVNVPAGNTGSEFSELRIVNVVTPKITPDAGQTQLPPNKEKKAAKESEIEIAHRFLPEPKELPEVGPLKLTFRYDETLPAKAYQGEGTVLAPGLKLYRDEKCKKKFAHKRGKKLTNAELKQGVDLWITGADPGDVDVTLTLDDSNDPDISVRPKATAKVTVDPPVKRLTPMLIPEYLVVMKDRELWKEQRKNDSKDGSAAAADDEQIKPDPVRLVAKVIEGEGDAEYTGKGTLTVPGNIALFEDEELKTSFDASAKIDFDALKGEGLTLWMHGKTAGLCTISLELDATTDAKFLVDPKAEGEIGCVDLEFKLHHYTETDVNKAINPDVADCDTYWNALKALNLEQKEMTDAEKAKPGRMLHKQDSEKHHQRAKLVVQKVNKDHWPKTAKDYELVLSLGDRDAKTKTQAGSLKMFDAAMDGSNKALPHAMALDTCKSKEQEFWIEGDDVGDGWRSVRLSLGMDRPEGGPEKTPKQDADWAAFTVVQIKEVLCKVENEAGKEKVIDGAKFYINLHDKGRELKDKAGISKCAVTAELVPALEGVDIHFQVVEHKDTYAIAKAPAALKQKKIQDLKQAIKPVDRPDPKKLLHFKATTDASGKAKTEDLQSPQIGQAKFKIGAYLLQDAEQARYVEDHADLKKFAPVLSSTWLEVWRRLFFKLFAMKRWSGACYSDRFDEAALSAQMEALGITLEKKGESLARPFQSVLVEGAGTQGFLDWSRAPLGNGGDREMYLCLISGRHKGVDVRSMNLGNPTNKATTWTINRLMRVKGTASRADWLDTCKATHLGVDYDLRPKATLAQTQDFQFKISIDFEDVWNQIKAANAADPDGGTAKADAFLSSATIDFKWKESKSSSGVSWHEAVVVCMDTREPSHATENAKNSATHTFLHEIGHYVGLAAKTLADKGKTTNPNFYSDQAGEGNANGSGGTNPVLPGEGSWGLGPHCDGTSSGSNCLMWHSFKMTLNYCDTCNFNVRTRVLHSPIVAARDDF
jgi:hypothetical protein